MYYTVICSSDENFAVCFGKFIVLTNYICILLRQELSVGVLCKYKHSTVLPQLTITMVVYGTNTIQKWPFPWGDLDRSLLKHGFLGPSESLSQTASRLVQLFLHSSQ